MPDLKQFNALFQRERPNNFAFNKVVCFFYLQWGLTFISDRNLLITRLYIAADVVFDETDDFLPSEYISAP